MQDHELRDVLNNEILGRPGINLTPPAKIIHLVLTFTPQDDPSALLSTISERLGLPAPAAGAKHYSATVDGLFFKYERHGEFCQISFARSGLKNLRAPIIADEVLEKIPGRRLVALQMEILGRKDKKPTAAAIAAYFGHEDVAASSLAGEKAVVWTDFRIGQDRYTRILMQEYGLSPIELGRLARAVLEIETYRMMALLTFPVAQKLQKEISQIEHELSQTVERMVDTNNVDNDATLLQSLSLLARDVEDISNQNSFRFAAARAYSALVAKRITELDEVAVPGFQSLGVFLDRRFNPAMATCLAVDNRISALAGRTERAGNLLRTRVDIALEAQNQKLLRSMETRARHQLMLQETVEGISVVAISYYLLYIVSKFVNGSAAQFFGEKVKVPEWVLIPLVVGAVFWMIRSRRNKIKNRADHSEE